MKVRELIAELQKQDQELDVWWMSWRTHDEVTFMEEETEHFSKKKVLRLG